LPSHQTLYSSHDQFSNQLCNDEIINLQDDFHPAEFYALANAFLFALHNMLQKRRCAIPIPPRGDQQSLINIIFSGCVDLACAVVIADQRSILILSSSDFFSRPDRLLS